jgi:hypothetical protein
MSGHNWTPEQQRAKYHARRANGQCTRCGGKMLPEWGTASLCPECQEYAKRTRRTYYKSAKGKAAQKAWRDQAGEAFREKERARQRRLKQERKVDGICRCCPSPSLDDSVYCSPCRDKNRAMTRETMRRLRARRAAERMRAAATGSGNVEDAGDLRPEERAA